MPQVFQVLRCYKCLVFQVQQAKKSHKWQCKLCGEKQSIKRHYGIGTAKDCRIHVQKLNSMRAEMDELKCSQMQKDATSDEEVQIEALEVRQALPEPKLVKNSKWSNYVEEAGPVVQDNNESMCLVDTEVVLEIPKKRRKQIQNNFRNNYRTLTPTVSAKHIVHSSQIVNDNIPVCFKASEDSPSITANTLSLSKETPYMSMGKENSKPNVPQKKFVPPVINKDSKWAGYVEDEDTDVTASDTIEPSQNDCIFSLCDENELDDVLDI